MDRIENDAMRPGDLVIPIERVPVAAFQAIYHNLTKKTDFLRHRYDKPVEITVHSITDLHYHIIQTMSQFSVKANSSRVVFSLKNGEIVDISSVEKFSATNLQGFSHCSQSITIMYDYLIIRPVEMSEAEDVSQRFRVKVEASAAREVISQYVDDSPFYYDYVKRQRVKVSTEIEYADVAISRSLQAVLNEWVDRHTVVRENTISEEAAKRWSKYTKYASAIVAIGVLIGSIFLELDAYKNILTPLRYILIVLALTVGLTAAAEFAIDRVKDLIDSMRVKTYFNLTSGDNKIIVKEDAARASAKSRIYLIFGGVFLTFLVGLVVNYVSTLLLPNS